MGLWVGFQTPPEMLAVAFVSSGMGVVPSSRVPFLVTDGIIGYLLPPSYFMIQILL